MGGSSGSPRAGAYHEESIDFAGLRARLASARARGEGFDAAWPIARAGVRGGRADVLSATSEAWRCGYMRRTVWGAECLLTLAASLEEEPGQRAAYLNRW